LSNGAVHSLNINMRSDTPSQSSSRAGMLKQFFRNLRTGNKPATSEYPPNVLIEVTNACNLRCRMCFIWGEGVGRRREVGFVGEEVWKAAIDEIGSWPINATLDLHGAGEPLLHPRFFEIAEYAKRKGNISVGFLSNATLLDENKARAVVSSGIDWVAFSVDGAQKEIFEYYRRGARFEQVEENIGRLLSLRNNGRPAVSFNMVSHQEADLAIFIDRWKGKVDSLTLSSKRPPNRKEDNPIVLTGPCPLLSQQLVVAWNGVAALCCEDFWGDYVVGRFPGTSLYKIWHGRALTKARRLQERGDYRKISLCRQCNAGELHGYEEWTEERNGSYTLVRKERRTAVAGDGKE
jgi:pyruvate-formate lyase-activating enzyme